MYEAWCEARYGSKVLDNGVTLSRLSPLMNEFFGQTYYRDFVSSVNAGHPAICCVKNYGCTGSTGGHAIVVCGYNNPYDIIYIDPDNGKEKIASPSILKARAIFTVFVNSILK